MRKISAILLVLAVLLTFVACNDENSFNYDGEKLSYTEMLKGDGTIDKRWYYKYYPDGEISTSMRCLEDGTCVQRNEYTYTEDNLKKTETIYILGKKTSVTEYSYTEDKKLYSEKNYLPTEITETLYYYNGDGTLDYTEKRNANGDLMSSHRYTYTADKLIEESFFDALDNKIGSILYTYSKDYIKTVEYSGIAVKDYAKEDRTYDGENLIKTLFYNAEGQLLYTDTAEYDGDRCMHRLRVDSNNSIVYTWDAYYDSFVSLIG